MLREEVSWMDKFTSMLAKMLNKGSITRLWRRDILIFFAALDLSPRSLKGVFD